MFTQLLGEERAAISVWGRWLSWFRGRLPAGDAWTDRREAMDDFDFAARTWAESHFKIPRPSLPNSGVDGMMETCHLIARCRRLRRRCKVLLGTAISDDYTARKLKHLRRHSRRWDTSRHLLPWSDILSLSGAFKSIEGEHAAVPGSTFPLNVASTNTTWANNTSTRAPSLTDPAPAINEHASSF